MLATDRKLSIKIVDDFSSQKSYVDSENASISTSKSRDLKSRLKSLPKRIPAFGLLMSLISAVFYSFQSVIVKVLTDLHPIEILVFRFVNTYFIGLSIVYDLQKMHSNSNYA